MTAANHTHVRTGIPEAAAGARAAGLLVDACAAGESLQVRVVRDAAFDIQHELNALQNGASTPDALADATARCADLANLATCNVPYLAAPGVAKAVAATHLAVGAARALESRIEAAAKELDEPRFGYLVRDARGAAWRARLAASQVDELLAARNREV